MPRAYDKAKYRRAAARMKNVPCVTCGRTPSTADHIVPLAEGGSEDASNLQPLCAFHNSQKGSATRMKLRRGAPKPPKRTRSRKWGV